jgi:hypothetical protein
VRLMEWLVTDQRGRAAGARRNGAADEAAVAEWREVLRRGGAYSLIGPALAERRPAVLDQPSLISASTTALAKP